MTNIKFSFKHISKNKKLLNTITGLTSEEITTMRDKVKDEWERVKYSRRKISNRQRKMGGGRKLKINNLEDRIVIFYFYAKYYPSYALLEVFTNIDNATICRLINEMAKVLGKKMIIDKDKEKMTTPDELFNHYPELKEILLDATEQRINTRDNDFHSGKKGMKTIKTQIITDDKGRILYSDDYSPGRKHDSKYLRESKIGDYFNKKPPLVVLADAGYQGMGEVFGINIFTPEKRSRKKKNLSTDDKTWNKNLSRKRSVVENAFSKIKKYKILAESYHNRRENYSYIFRAVSNIINLRMATN